MADEAVHITVRSAARRRAHCAQGRRRQRVGLDGQACDQPLPLRFEREAAFLRWFARAPELAVRDEPWKPDLDLINFLV